jgi:SAM-dependent methyltransferase
VNVVTALFRVPHVRALVSLIGDTRSSLRLHFLYAAMHAGLLQALRAPSTKEELVQRLGVQRPELLEALLALGVSLKELSESGGRYRLRGRRSKALVTPEGDPAFAMVEEILIYHADVYRRLGASLRGAAPGNYLDEHAILIARSSRVLDPMVGDFVRSLTRTGRPLRMLEVGCGSGIYLRYAAEANPQLTGVAVDVQEEVVKQARENVQAWGVGDRFQVHVADIRRPPPEVAGPFDLITLYNNVYYFEEAERPALFRSFRSWLAPGGAFALVSMFHGRTSASIDLDLALRCTAGCTGLPDLEQTARQLLDAGFSDVKKAKLMPGEPLWGLVAR